MKRVLQARRQKLLAELTQVNRRIALTQKLLVRLETRIAAGSTPTKAA